MRKILLGLAITSVFLTVNALAQTEVKVEHRVNDHAQGTPQGYSPTIGSQTSLSALLPHSGPVIDQPTIYLIWYGNWNQSNGTDTPAGQQIVRDWASGIGSSDYFKINATYTAKPVSGTAVFGAEATDSGTATRLSDNDILTIVGRTIDSGKLPYNANGVYFVITSSDVSESSGFCSRYCGWHTDGNTSSGKHVRFSFVGNAARCSRSCEAQTVSPNGNAGVDGAISVLSHELEEATTDPDLNAWYDSSGAENGDKCAWTFGNQTRLSSGAYYNMSFNNRNWLIQRNVFFNGSSWFCARTSAGAN